MPQGERVVVFDGIEHHFPGEATDAQISAALKAIPAANAPMAPKARTWSEPSDSTGLAIGATGKVVSGAANAVAEFATNPNTPKATAAVGRVLGALAPVVGETIGGAKLGGLGGAAAGFGLGVAGAARGSWAGGRTGYFTGKLAQKAALPVAKVLLGVAPYVETLAKVAGPQNALDLAQMAEPNRKDIGVLGVGTSDEPRSAADQAAHPALINLALAKVSEAVKYLMDQGMKQGEAVRLVMNAKAKGGK